MPDGSIGGKVKAITEGIDGIIDKAGRDPLRCQKGALFERLEEVKGVRQGAGAGSPREMETTSAHDFSQGPPLGKFSSTIDAHKAKCAKWTGNGEVML